MIEKGALSWKEFYDLERREMKDAIHDRILDALRTCDRDVLEVIERGGVLSFPHTVLHGSLDPLVKTARALIESGRKRVLALAVLHSDDVQDEFSMDGFEYVLEEMKKEMGVEYPEISILYPPLSKVDPKDLGDRIRGAVEDGGSVKDRLDEDTALVITGDLCHFGKTYNRVTECKDVEAQIDEWIEEALDLVYRRGDVDAFVKHARRIGNDQWLLNITVRSLMGGDLDYRIFQKKVTDYSRILGEPPPTVVASYFYGVWRK